MSNLPLHQLPGSELLSGLIVANKANKASSIKCNFAAVAAPTVGDDSDDGYQLLSWWIYSGQIWLCMDATVGAALWVPMGVNADYVGAPGGTVNAIAGSIGVTKLVAGLTVKVKMTGPNTAVAPTFNLDTLGAATIKSNGLDAPIEAWATGDVVALTYDGTNWQLTTGGSGSDLEEVVSYV